MSTFAITTSSDIASLVNQIESLSQHAQHATCARSLAHFYIILSH